MQSITPNFILSFPNKGKNIRNTDTVIKMMKRSITGIDMKVKGMLKSFAGIAYFVTLVYFLTILLT